MRRIGPAALVALATGIVASGCSSGDGLEGDRARVDTPELSVELDIDGCGLDPEEGVLVLGASSPTVLVQLALVVADDRVDRAASALTVSTATGGTLAAGDAATLDADPGRVGTITSATIRGDRVEVEAEARSLDGDVAATAGTVTVVARCPAVDVDVAGAAAEAPAVT